MKRKVIQIGQTSKIISLPKQWADKNKIEKGDEISLNEVNNRLIIENPKFFQENTAEFEIDKFDRTSIQLLIRSAYFSGVTKIILKYSKRKFIHYRDNTEKDVEAIINEELMRISGYTLIEIDDQHAVIELLSKDSPDDFMKFYTGALNEFERAMNHVKVECLEDVNFEGYHNKISLFLNMASRNILNHHVVGQKYNLIFALCRQLDQLLDIYKYFFRYYKRLNVKANPELKSMVVKITDFNLAMTQYLKDAKYKNLTNMYELKEKAKYDIIKLNDATKGENLLFGYLSSILEISFNILISQETLNMIEAQDDKV